MYLSSIILGKMPLRPLSPKDLDHITFDAFAPRAKLVVLQPMLDQYLPILMQVLIAAGLAAGMLLASVLLGKSAKRNAMKDSAYECGMLPLGEGQPRFSVKFYIVAMLFVLFDIEVVFLYPWAVIYKEYVIANGAALFWWGLSFVSILLVAFLYAWRKGALKWE